MKKFITTFLKRGVLAAGGGPLILVIVYFFLSMSGVVETVSVSRIMVEILSSMLMAFVAAGISAIYSVERIQYGMAGLIQGSVLFLDYIGVYLLNGWLPMTWTAVTLFTVIFIAMFIVVWLIVYISVRKQTERMNAQIKQS